MAFKYQQSNFPDYGATGSGPSETRARSDSSKTLYHQCCDSIIFNILTINNNIAALEISCKDIGTEDDSDLLRDKIHTVKQQTNSLITSTMRFVNELKRLAQTAGKEQRLQADRLENEFKDTVQRYDSMQKQLVPKMRQAMLPPKKRPSNVWGVEDYEEEKQSLVDAEKLQQQRQIQDELEFEKGMLSERESRIKQIENDILDVNQIFRDLASMVNVQGEMIGGLEENISNAAQEVEMGTRQLAKASQYQNKYRKKLCWLVLILLIVAAIITLIIYLSR